MIGGEYFIKLKPVEDSLLYSLSALCPSHAFYSSGRDAIFGVLNQIASRRIWLPDFICQSIHDSIRQTGRQLLYYPINAQLQPELSWLDQIQRGDIVFITHLFGIVPHALLKSLKETGAVVVSDLTQKLYNLSSWQNVALQSDYVLSSLRKTMALPDGAFVGSSRHDVIAPRELPSDEFWALRAAALMSRGGSANQGFMRDENIHLFKKAEAWADANPAASRKMSDCARALLATMSENEWDAERKLTHHNQAILAAHLSDRLPCPQVRPTMTLPEIAVSVFFPILLEHEARDKIKAVLAGQRIYCPVHWDTAFLDTPHPVSQKILSIPCDARYTKGEMKYVATVILANL